MSGDNVRNSRSNITQGWEEAGAEFYQESYPGDLENLQRDSAAIATLLPSKQNRAATAKRSRSNHQETKYARRNQQLPEANRNSNTRCGSQYQDVHISMLPDLSQDLTDEERIWEEIHEIKSMPVSMAQKKILKVRLQNATKLRLQGFDQIKWQQRKAWQQFQAKWIQLISKTELWRDSLKHIEGNFGTGVVAYFLFLRWLMFLNLGIFILILSFILIPHVTLNEPTEGRCNETYESVSSQCCYENYLNRTKTAFNMLDIIQGTGFMEKTLMFYGMYTNKIFANHIDQESYLMQTQEQTEIFFSNQENVLTYVTIDKEKDKRGIINSSQNYMIQNNGAVLSSYLYYDLPLAYISITVVYFLISLLAIMKAASREFKDRLVDGEGQFYQYCNLVFGGWDFCIHNEKSSHIKHKALYNEIKGLLHSNRMEYERFNRSREFMCKLIVIRVIVNVFVFIILGLSALLIYYLFNVSLKYLEPSFTKLEPFKFMTDSTLEYMLTVNKNNTKFSHYSETDTVNSALLSNNLLNSSNKNDSRFKSVSKEFYQLQLVILFFEFLPSIAIVCLNLLVPILFNYLCDFEEYSPMFVIKISLFRTIFLRLSSLVVLLSRFYVLIIPTDEEECYKNIQKPQCWETFVGQQFYKLVITDFVTHFIVTFFVNFPRSLIAKHMKTKLAKILGEQEFELSKHVLDIVYSQTLCWLGAFYSPFLPAVAAALTFFMFYIKKFQCLINSKPSGILYRASRSNSLFMFILLVSYVVAVVPVVYAVAEIRPSKSCGPFRGLNSVWDYVILSFMKLPLIFQNLIFFLGTAGFAIPWFIVLTLFLYYYHAVSDANKHMVEVLKNQLVLEGHDKQFLLNRLSLFIKQQQECRKKIRHSDHKDFHLPPKPTQQNQQLQRSRDRNIANRTETNEKD